MNKFQREDFLFLARIAQQTERFNDMIEFIKHFLDQELTKEERSILSAAYKNVVRPAFEIGGQQACGTQGPDRHRAEGEQKTKRLIHAH